MSNTIIEFRNIHKRFGGIHAVKGVSFTIDRGEVHTILGENGAGKSTLMNMLSGIYTPSEGEILFKGKAVHISNPLKARELGISTVFQELKLCPNLTVAENIFLGRELKKKARPDWKLMIKQAQEKLVEFGLDIDVTQHVVDLSAAQMQLVEIAKAMFINSEVLILDEPTSSLTYEEADKLFKTIHILKERGVAIIFISHRMQEVFEISDKISLMRNGEYLSTYDIGDVTPEKVVSLISGREEKEIIQDIQKKESKTFSKDIPIALEVRNLNCGKIVQDASFKLRQGEILGFYGLQGAGRTELMEAIYGLRKIDGGEIFLYGQKQEMSDVDDRMKNGIAMVPEDRKRVGLFMNFNVMENVAAIHGKDIVTKLRILNKRKMKSIAEEFVSRLNIRTDGVTQMVQDLSGGNQQKVVMSKCLSIAPRILILDEPTRGVDVGAKTEIFQLLQSLREGKEDPVSIIVVSSELSEVVAECDRIIVIRQGRIVGELENEEIDKDNVLQLAFNG